MSIYTCDNIHVRVIQDSEDIIEYDDMMNNNQILTSSGEVQL